ncbi:MAG: MAPEG family protein [Pseudomonadota bacterium]
MELSCLAWSVLLGLIHIIAAANARTLELGVKWNMSARDGDPAKLSPLTGRLLRAQSNFFETFPLFAASILMVVLTDSLSVYSYWGAVLYLGARNIYLPLYAFGISVIRSLIWLVSIGGLLMVLLPMMF